jgi:hypothetical protein
VPRSGRVYPKASETWEPMTGIEPAYSAWEADVLPLNYIGLTSRAGENED